MQSILTAIFTAIMSFLKDFIDESQRRTDHYNAKSTAKLNQALRNVDLEAARIRDVKVSPPKTPLDFNRITPVLTMSLLLVNGCVRYIYVDSPRPLIEPTTRPTLPVEPPTFTPREQMLVDWGSSMEAKISLYNEIAAEYNRKATQVNP